ncbi:MAG TPA: hypothetical protein VFZ93_05075 [Albitalea sp.]
MTIHPSLSEAATPPQMPPAGGLEKVLRVFSVLTLAMTVPQAWSAWFGETAGVSLVSWATYLLSALLWFVYGWRKRDRTIWVACIGWIVVDAAIVAGIVVRG